MRALKQTEFVEISKEIVVTTQAHEGIEIVEHTFFSYSFTR